MPLAYATTQNNRANVLSDLASLPGEDRAARLRQALANAASAVHIFEQAQQAQYLQVGRRVLAGVIVAMGAAEARAAWAALTDRPIPPLPADLLLSALAEQTGVASQDEFEARLQDDPAFHQQVQELAAFAGAETRALDGAQTLADQLIAWSQTPDWEASEAYLQKHAADLLTDQAAAVLDLLHRSNPDSAAIPQHQTLLHRCRAIGIGPAYREFHAARVAASPLSLEGDQDDPAAQALAALFQVDSSDALEQTLAHHPVLLELPTLERLAGLVTEAEAAQSDAVRHLLALLAVLLERYNHAHAEQVDLGEQAQFVALHESLLPLAESLDATLVVGLRRSLGWALNTLGNAHAERGDHAAAVEAYTRAIDHDPENAMLYRNRAGEHIEMEQWPQAEADVAQAAALEPDAPRLTHLREALAQRPAQP